MQDLGYTSDIGVEGGSCRCEKTTTLRVGQARRRGKRDKRYGSIPSSRGRLSRTDSGRLRKGMGHSAARLRGSI